MSSLFTIVLFSSLYWIVLTCQIYLHISFQSSVQKSQCPRVMWHFTGITELLKFICFCHWLLLQHEYSFQLALEEQSHSDFIHQIVSRCVCERWEARFGFAVKFNSNKNYRRRHPWQSHEQVQRWTANGGHRLSFCPGEGQKAQKGRNRNT